MTKHDGYDEFLYPKEHHLVKHRDTLLKYLTSYDTIKNELGDILRKIAKHNTVVVTTVNTGQVELLMNFICASRSKGFDLSNLIVFPTDEYSRDIAVGMGVATYYAEKVCLLCVCLLL